MLKRCLIEELIGREDLAPLLRGLVISRYASGVFDLLQPQLLNPDHPRVHTLHRRRRKQANGGEVPPEVQLDNSCRIE